MKRKSLSDITNQLSQNDIEDRNRWAKFDESQWLPLQPTTILEPIPALPPVFIRQNVHPMLAFYQYDLPTVTMSHDTLSRLLDPCNELELLHFLSEAGVIARMQNCNFCGGNMHFYKNGNTWYWICTRRVNGVKCNRGKKSVRDGTFLDKSHLSIQAIIWIVWHFVHKLSEQQCKQYTNMGQKSDTTVVTWYGKCREVCETWIWRNKPKLGGFGKIVEMDESHFAGTSKYGKGRRNGEDPWKGLNKWVFGLTERGSLDCILKSVHSSRSREVVLPLINDNCAIGTIFCSDGWRAYLKLSENVDIEDTLHFAVNHTKNYVDPDTGAHTQTIEGLWRHCKQYLPAYGMKPKHLDSYLSTFMWFRFVEQRKLDIFKHFLQCASNVFPPTLLRLPTGTVSLTALGISGNEECILADI